MTPQERDAIRRSIQRVAEKNARLMIARTRGGVAAGDLSLADGELALICSAAAESAAMTVIEFCELRYLRLEKKSE